MDTQFWAELRKIMYTPMFLCRLVSFKMFSSVLNDKNISLDGSFLTKKCMGQSAGDLINKYNRAYGQKDGSGMIIKHLSSQVKSNICHSITYLRFTCYIKMSPEIIRNSALLLRNLIVFH